MDAEWCTPPVSLLRTRALDELSEEAALATATMEPIVGFTAVKELLDLAYGLSLAASQTRGFGGPPKSLIFSDIVTGVRMLFDCVFG